MKGPSEQHSEHRKVGEGLTVKLLAKVTGGRHCYGFCSARIFYSASALLGGHILTDSTFQLLTTNIELSLVSKMLVVGSKSQAQIAMRPSISVGLP